MQFLTELLKKFPDIDKEKAQNYINFCLEHRFEGDHEKYFVERHHILPKNDECFPEYAKTEENIVALSYKDHYIAHALLADFLPLHYLTYCWLAMNNMNSKRFNDDMSLNISAELYESLKIKAKKNNSEILKGKTVGLINGKYALVDVDTYHKLGLKSPFDGRLNVLDKKTGKKKWILSEEFDSNLYAFPLDTTGVVFAVSKKTLEKVRLEKSYFDSHRDEYWHSNQKVNGVYARDLAKMNETKEKGL